MARFKVEFYKPSIIRPDGTSFIDILNQISDMPVLDRIRRDVDPAIVLNIDRAGDEYFGEAARIRMDELPSVIDVASGQRHDLEVQEHEGLGEEIYFLFDQRLDVIAIQRTAHFRASSLEALLGDLTETGPDFRLIIKRDAWENFQNMGMITKIKFKLARPRDLEGQPLPALLGFFRQIDEFNGVLAKIEISVGREQNHYLVREALDGLVAAFRRDEASFKSLSITGRIRAPEEDGELARLQTLDFVKEQLVFVTEVERRGRSRRLDSESCRVALREAIRGHRGYLRRFR